MLSSDKENHELIQKQTVCILLDLASFPSTLLGPCEALMWYVQANLALLGAIASHGMTAAQVIDLLCYSQMSELFPIFFFFNLLG